MAARKDLPRCKTELAAYCAIVHAIHQGYLEIDQCGRVWRLAYNSGVGRSPGTRVRRTCIRRRAEAVSLGYGHVRVQIDGVKYRIAAHRLVWMWFNNQMIPDGLTVNHINGERMDNRPENLELLTMKGQYQHAKEVLGRPGGARGERHGATALARDSVVAIRERYANGEYQTELAKEYGASQCTIGRIVRGDSWAIAGGPITIGRHKWNNPRSATHHSDYDKPETQTEADDDMRR